MIYLPDTQLIAYFYQYIYFFILGILKFYSILTKMAENEILFKNALMLEIISCRTKLGVLGSLNEIKTNNVRPAE